MELTRRGHAVVGTAGTLLLVGALGDRPLAVAGAATLCAWLLVAQHRAAARFVECDDSLSVTVTPARPTLRPKEPGTVAVTVESDEASDLPVSAAVGWPVGVSGEHPTLTLGSGDERRETTCEFSAPLGGRYEIPEVTCTYTDGSGLFEQAVERPERASVVVETASPSDLQVGGEDFAAKMYGDHPSGQSGAGTDVVGIRQYVPGDSVSRIDWNSTARLGDAYVRELEDETAHRTRMFLDRRESMADGRPGRRKSDYLREVLLGIVRLLERNRDPVGLTLIDEDGIRVDTEMREAPRHYGRCRRILNSEGGGDARVGAVRRSEGWTGTPSNAARRIEAKLSRRDDEFAAALRPFFEPFESYTRRFNSDPLFNGLRVKTTAEPARGWTVLCTDDTHPQETREAVKATVREGTLVTVFLTPTVLFDGSHPADDRTYERYADFERFRKQLDAMPGVRAYEVAPGRTREAVLEVGRSRRDTGGQNGGESRART
ncbi:DUF58 domain-containing protein [Halopelagius longus]|uniref:DUF58 domain-containing protein n=1 Tax=Halopelagius longus TaxID=1236180 RepID=A0A1H1GLG2_9EURY|nr:DUF58 domain-containing protein [Halopelagius longus]RDI69684.1 DUF58 domain-containing protein [Halopelagius longus]SDR13716.1 Uncharacterized conserved protein, DUF58 family, contains vWF domain [Halopelagius longus]